MDEFLKEVTGYATRSKGPASTPTSPEKSARKKKKPSSAGDSGSSEFAVPQTPSMASGSGKKKTPGEKEKSAASKNVEATVQTEDTSSGSPPESGIDLQPQESQMTATSASEVDPEVTITLSQRTDDQVRNVSEDASAFFRQPGARVIRLDELERRVTDSAHGASSQSTHAQQWVDTEATLTQGLADLDDSVRNVEAARNSVFEQYRRAVQNTAGRPNPADQATSLPVGLFQAQQRQQPYVPQPGMSAAQQQQQPHQQQQQRPPTPPVIRSQSSPGRAAGNPMGASAHGGAWGPSTSPQVRNPMERARAALHFAEKKLDSYLEDTSAYMRSVDLPQETTTVLEDKLQVMENFFASYTQALEEYQLGFRVPAGTVDMLLRDYQQYLRRSQSIRDSLRAHLASRDTYARTLPSARGRHARRRHKSGHNTSGAGNTSISSSQSSGSGGSSSSGGSRHSRRRRRRHGRGPELSQLPQLTLEKFSGKPEEFPAWMAAFNEAIHRNRRLGSVSKFLILRQHLTGDAAAAIKHLTGVRGSYKAARKILKERYGHQHMIVQSTIRTLMEYQAQKRDKKGLQRALDDLRAIHYGMETAGVTESPEILQGIMLSKLGSSCRSKYSEWMSDRGEVTPTMEEFYEFLSKKIRGHRDETPSRRHRDSSRSRYAQRAPRTALVSNRDQGGSQQSRAKGQKGPQQQQKSGQRSYQRPQQKQRKPQSNQGGAPKCAFCLSAEHSGGSCHKKSSLSVEQRWQKRKENNACGVCLRTGHYFLNCPNMQTCPKPGCEKKHHVLLHSDAPPKQ